MIFDSERATRLVARYANLPDDFAPEFVVLARSPKYSDEREYFDKLVASAPEVKQKDWIGRLANDRHEQFLAAWFEIMLYGWLQEIGTVTAEPDVAGDSPDFLLSVKNTEIVVEAAALLISKEERERKQRESEVCWLLGQVDRPFVIDVPYAVFQGHLNARRFINAVVRWLDHSPEEEFEFRDGEDTKVRMAARPDPKLNSVVVDTLFRMERVSPKSIKPILLKKSRQHRAVKTKGLAFVVAVLLESQLLSPIHVVQAWMGKRMVRPDLGTGKELSQWFDGSGMIFSGINIRHTRVSGMSVFHRDWCEGSTRRVLKSWYVQNPAARIPLNPSVFPVNGSLY